jgi:hypothetical protein
MGRRSTLPHALVLALLGFFTASCTTPAPEAPREEGVEIVVETGALPLVFEPPTLHLGRVVPGGIIDGRARIRNVGGQPVRVVNFNAPCECTSAEPDLPRTLAPGESFSFPVTLSLGRLPRGGLSLEGAAGPEEVHRSLTVWTADGRAAELPLIAELSEELVVEPVVTDFRTVPRGGMETATVRVGPGRGRPGRPVAIVSVETLPGSFPVRVEERPAEAGLELDLIAGPFSEGGPGETELRLLTDAEPEAVRLLLKAEVVEALVLMPQAVHQPRASPAQPVVAKVHVRRRDGLPIALESATTEHGSIKLTPLGESPNGAQVLRVVIGVPPWPAEVRGEITLQTDFPGEAGRLTLPVFVQARPPR